MKQKGKASKSPISNKIKLDSEKQPGSKDKVERQEKPPPYQEKAVLPQFQAPRNGNLIHIR